MNASFVTAFDGWNLTEEADRRFRKISGTMLLLFIVLGILIPLIQLTGLQRGGGETVEQRYVSILPEAPVAEQVEEDGRDQFGGFALRFAAEAHDAFGAAEQIDNAALFGAAGKRNSKLFKKSGDDAVNSRAFLHTTGNNIRRFGAYKPE